MATIVKEPSKPSTPAKTPASKKATPKPATPKEPKKPPPKEIPATNQPIKLTQPTAGKLEPEEEPIPVPQTEKQAGEIGTAAFTV